MGNITWMLSLAQLFLILRVLPYAAKQKGFSVIGIIFAFLFFITSRQWIRPQDIVLLHTGEPCVRACQDDYFGREAEHWLNLIYEAGDRWLIFQAVKKSEA